MKLRPYQELIVRFILEHPRSLVLAGMGLGKTVSTLTALAMLHALEGEGPALILAPLRVAKSSWPDEIAKWTHLRHLRCAVICGTAAERAAAVETQADVYCMNYENLAWLDEYLQENDRPWPFPIVVADESTRLKSFRTRQGGKRARALGRHYGEIKRFIELTGTPAPNGYLDLWGQVWFLDHGARLGKTMSAYQETYFRPIRVGAQAFAVRWDILPGADKMIQEKIADLTIRINTEDYFPVDEPIVTDIRVELPDAVRKEYRRMERDMLAEIASTMIATDSAGAKTIKCLQMASGAVYAEDENGERTVVEVHDEKLKALESIVNEAEGNALLVAYQFKHDAQRIKRKFPKARILDKNPQTIRDWNAGKIPMLLAHPASCGHGLSLQDGGCRLVFFSTGWDLEQHDQIIERIGPTRQKQAGHPRPVYVYNIIAKGTIDEAVQERIKTKRRVLDILLERRNHDDA